MNKKILYQGLATGLLSALSCLIYSQFYYATTGADFSSVITIFPVMITCLLGCLLAAGGYLLLSRFVVDIDSREVIFNISFVFLTFVSCIYPLSQKLSPSAFESPELFYGLVIPMHFFPVLFWITLNPMFKGIKDA